VVTEMVVAEEEEEEGEGEGEGEGEEEEEEGEGDCLLRLPSAAAIAPLPDGTIAWIRTPKFSLNLKYHLGLGMQHS
jgi:hypothetical protein